MKRTRRSLVVGVIIVCVATFDIDSFRVKRKANALCDTVQVGATFDRSAFARKARLTSGKAVLSVDQVSETPQEAALRAKNGSVIVHEDAAGTKVKWRVVFSSPARSGWWGRLRKGGGWSYDTRPRAKSASCRFTVEDGKITRKEVIRGI
jgi:hypothetical protein